MPIAVAEIISLSQCKQLSFLLVMLVVIHDDNQPISVTVSVSSAVVVSAKAILAISLATSSTYVSV